MQKNKTFFTTILILLLTFSAFAAIIPNVEAHDPPWEIPTWCYISASPNPVGVTQEVAVVFWVNAYIPTAEGAYGDRWDFEIDITKPDGNQETFGPITSDPVGGGYFMYTPDQVGPYTFTARFLGYTITGLPLYPGKTLETINGAEFVGDTFLPSTSDPVTLTVQQDLIEPWPEAPPPSEYWTRPVYGANREWWPFTGNWLSGAAQNVGSTTSFAYSHGPESAHILWATPYWDGGVMDARFGSDAYYQGLSYESYWNPPIILNGRLYYNVMAPPRYGWYTVDLYTGEKLFFQNTTGPMSSAWIEDGEQVTYPSPLRVDSSGAYRVGDLSFGQILAYHSPNQHGGFPYLWSTNGPEPDTWMMFDAFTGNYICSIANVSSRGINVYGKDGSILYYNIAGSGENRRLTVWNTTHAIQENYDFMRNWYWAWRPFLNKTLDGQKGFFLNVSIPDVQGSILEVREDEFLIGGTSGKKNATHTIEGTLWALSLEPGNEGTLLWEITFVPPETRPDEFYPVGTRAGVQGPYVYPEDGVFVFRDKEELVWFGYSLESGEQIWGPTEEEAAQNYYSTSSNVYNGMLITYGYGGELRAYNLQNGETLWKYQAIPEGFEYYGFENCPLSLGAIADGKIYVYTTEHSPNTPLRRSSYIRCINAENGEELWKILHWGSRPSIADGILVDLNLYDNRIYAYGKGPTQTSVLASPKITQEGSSIMIEGSVMDISAGTLQHEVAMRFPDGVPAVADGNQQGWMEHVYMQQTVLDDVVGVPVVLTIVDPNGEVHEVSAVSDANGKFGVMWTPPMEGKYTVVATFEGSKSYYPSSAETFFGVGIATTTPASPSPSVAPPPTSEMPATTYVAIGVAVIIIGAAATALFLRRRK